METVQKNLISLEPVALDDGKELFGNFILPDEKVCFTFKGIRDRAVITNKRIIFIDVQGITGKKKELLFIPFSKITAFSIETAGTLDANAELKIWESGVGGLKLNFTPKTDIFEIGQFIGQFII